MNEKQIKEYCRKLGFNDSITEFVTVLNFMYNKTGVKKLFGNLNLVDAIKDGTDGYEVYNNISEKERFLIGIGMVSAILYIECGGK